MEENKYLNIRMGQQTLETLKATGEVFSRHVQHNLVETFLLLGTIWYEVTFDNYTAQDHDEHVCLVPVLNGIHCIDGYDTRIPRNLQHPEKIKDFLSAIRAVCVGFGVSISHEDHHGAFELIDYEEGAFDWLTDAHVNLKPRTI